MIQVLLSGMALGCIYALIALGFVLIYKATETVNFAQGEMMMMGAMAAVILTVWVGLPIWAAVGVAIIGMTGFGLLIERLVVRPVLGQPQIAVVMLTIGLGYMMRGGVTMLPMIGTRTNTLTLPYQGEVWALGSVVISVEQVMIIAMTLILCAALYVLFRYTRIGIAMQATSQNQIAAILYGDSGQAAERAGLGPVGRSGNHCRHPAGADYLCPCQYGFHCTQSNSGGNCRWFWQSAGCCSWRAGDRSRRGAGRLLSA